MQGTRWGASGAISLLKKHVTKLRSKAPLPWVLRTVEAHATTSMAGGRKPAQATCWAHPEDAHVLLLSLEASSTTQRRSRDPVQMAVCTLLQNLQPPSCVLPQAKAAQKSSIVPGNAWAGLHCSPVGPQGKAPGHRGKGVILISQGFLEFLFLRWKSV